MRGMKSEQTSSEPTGSAAMQASGGCQMPSPPAARLLSPSHCAGCGKKLAADQIAKTITARAGAQIDLCRLCADGQQVLNLKTPGAKS
jgi:hypothetical protein